MSPWLVFAAVTAALLGGVVVYAVCSGRWPTEHQNADSLQTLGTTLVVIGIVFGTDRLVGYILIGVGVAMSIVSL